MNLEVIDIKGKNIGSIAADPKLFAVKGKDEVVASVLRWLQCSKRAGTHSALTRAEVHGGGRKPWKQKGTGRARAGTIRSPLWRHGGVIFGPKPRDYSYNLPRKVRDLALRMVLSDRARENKIRVIENMEIDQPKTKAMLAALKDMGIMGKKNLIVADKIADNLRLSSRNIRNLNVVLDKNMNIYDLLNAENVVITKAAVQNLKEKLA